MLDGNGIGTITDNDGSGPGEGISVADFTVDESVGTADFVITYTGPTVASSFTVDFVVTDGTAIDPDDYTVATIGTSVTFPAGTMNGDTQVVTVNIVDDMIIEGNEDLNINLSNISIPVINMLDGDAIGTITDNDGSGPGEGISVSDFTVDEGVGTADFVITYTGPTVQDAFTLDFLVTDGTAIDPDDYSVATVGVSVTFPAGTMDGDTQVVTVNIVDDMIIEGSEDLNITLSNISIPAINMVDGDGVGTITDNDGSGPGEGISVADFTVDESVGTADFVITYTGPTVQDAFTVDFVITDGTAIDPDDYSVATIGTSVTFPAGTADGDMQLVSINIMDDLIIEPSEDLNITLSNISIPSINMLDGDGIGTITDNDGSGPGEGISVADFTVDESVGTADFVITYTGPTVASSFTVDFVVTDGTAIDPDDYSVATVGVTVTFPAGTANGDTQVVTVNIVDDMILEGAETLEITLSNISIPAINMVDGTGVGTITDNDGNGPLEGISVSDFTVDESVGTVDFVISYTGNTVQDAFNVNFTVTDGSATSPDDYTATMTGTVTFPAGTANGDTQVVTVSIVDDALAETVEDLNIALAFDPVPPMGINMLDGNGIGTITDNDIMPSPYQEEVTIMCGEELPPAPELTFMGGCGNYTVVYDEVRQDASDSDDYMIIRTWDVTDACGNNAIFEQIVFVMQPQLEEVAIDICIEDAAIDLVDYLPAGFDTNGTFVAITDGMVLNGSVFDPMLHQLQEYLVEYSSTAGDCKYFVDLTITVNNDCVPCNVDDFTISKAITANGDNINDLFEIKGAEFCDSTFDVMVFNRWGNKVFEATDYQNDWGGYAPDNAIGQSGFLPTGTYYYIINVIGEKTEQINGYIYIGTQ
jgi:gliding motility-associated-like protein